MTHLDTNLLQPQNQIPPSGTGFCRYLILFLVLTAILGGAVYASARFFAPEQTEATFAAQKRPGFFSQIKNLMLSSDRQVKGQTEDRINILLLGMGGEGHDGPYLTDTIILASVKPSTRQVALLSIPRDLIMFIPGYGFRKINNADAFGETKEPGYGPILAAQVIGDTLEMPIHYYIRVDFQAFREIVDRLGGLKVYVDRAFSDSSFPTADYKTQTISFEEGWQTMDGETALRFARSRHGTGGESNDFARSRRQQKIILAAKNKIFSSFTFFNLGRVEDIYSSLTSHIKTNMEWWEIAAFYKMLKNLDYENMLNYVLEAGPGKPLVETMYNGASIIEPRGDNFDEIKLIAKNIFIEPSSIPAPSPGEALWAEPAPFGAQKTGAAPLKIEIQNGTWILGLAARTKVQLEERGIKIAEVNNAQTRDYGKTVIYDLSRGRFKKDLNQIKETLGAEVLTSQPKTSSTADILIIVGTDKNF